MTEITPNREVRGSSEEGSALVVTILILLLLTAVATGGYWVSRGEMSASQGYSMSVRALYVAESGLARYFAMNPVASEDTIVFVTEDVCADIITYPTQAEQDACYADDEDQEEEYLEEYVLAAPDPQVYALTGANVYITSDFIMNNGLSSIYEIRAEARVENAPDPGGYTVRAVDTWAELSPPFEITSVFAATGGVEFGGTGNEHHKIESIAKAGKDGGGCGSDVLLANVQAPEGTVIIPMPHVDCPGGLNCPYKWNLDMENYPDQVAVDTFYNNASEIIDEMGIDWDLLLDDAYWAGVDSVIEMNDSQDFMDYFERSKDKDFQAAEMWPITRYTGDISTDVRVKGYGFLIVDGDVLVTHDKIEWTGLMIVGGSVSTVNDGHLHVKGALIAGLNCTWGQINTGNCVSVLEGDHHDLKYRPCEIQKAWSRLMTLRPLDDLYREASPGW